MASSIDTAGRDLVEQRSFGWGLKALPMEITSPGEDYTRADIELVAGKLGEIAGRDALYQDLKIAYSTGRSTDPLNLSFGFDGARLIAEEDSPALLRERLRAAAAVVCDADPRVRKVLDVQLGPQNAPGARATALEITVQFETIVGEQTTLTVQGGSGG